MMTYGNFLLAWMLVIMVEGIVILFLALVYSIVLGVVLFLILCGLIVWLDKVLPELHEVDDGVL